MCQTDQQHQNYDYLESLSIERLEDQLYQCGEDDPELFDRIVEVIIKKEKENPSGRLMDVDVAWIEFKTLYITPDKIELNLHCDGSTKRYNAGAVDSENPPEPLQPKRRHSAFLRGTLSSAAVIAAVFMGVLAVQAAGFDVLGSFAQWTDEVLHFTSSTEPSQMEEPSPADITDANDPVQATLAEYGFRTDLVPQWLPEGFCAEDVRTNSTEAFDKVSCRYSGEDGFLDIQFFKYKDDSFSEEHLFEKDSESVEEYISNDRLFYLTSNVEQRIASWTDNGISIKITSSLSSDVLKSIIDSIGG